MESKPVNAEKSLLASTQYFLIVFTRSDLDYLLISLLERMKHVVGDAHWHSPMACVSVVSKRAVSEGVWKWSDYYFISTVMALLRGNFTSVSLHHFLIFFSRPTLSA